MPSKPTIPRRNSGRNANNEQQFNDDVSLKY